LKGHFEQCFVSALALLVAMIRSGLKWLESFKAAASFTIGAAQITLSAGASRTLSSPGASSRSRWVHETLGLASGRGTRE
jgi:hypothetical protein